MDTGQRRAVAGGEVGPNGEWYAGGTFIATTDRPKSAPLERVLSVEDEAERAERATRIASLAAWLESRRAQFAPIIATLTANVDGIYDAATWDRRVADHAAGFLPSLGRTLYMQGSLSEKQAHHVVKAILGRQTKRNAAEWDELFASLTEVCQ